MHCGILLLTNDELVIGRLQPINLAYLSNPGLNGTCDLSTLMTVFSAER